MLFRSRPDTVHRDPPHETQTSSLLTGDWPHNSTASDRYHPCCSGLQVQGTAISPAARYVYYTNSRHFCQLLLYLETGTDTRNIRFSQAFADGRGRKGIDNMKNDFSNSHMPAQKAVIPTLSRFRAAFRSKLSKTTLIITELILAAGLAASCYIYFFR